MIEKSQIRPMLPKVITNFFCSFFNMGCVVTKARISIWGIIDLSICSFLEAILQNPFSNWSVYAQLPELFICLFRAYWQLVFNITFILICSNIIALQNRFKLCTVPILLLFPFSSIFLFIPRKQLTCGLMEIKLLELYHYDK